MASKLTVLAGVMALLLAGCQHSHPAWNRGPDSMPSTAMVTPATAGGAQALAPSGPARSPYQSSVAGGPPQPDPRANLSIPGAAPQTANTWNTAPAPTSPGNAAAPVQPAGASGPALSGG